jgi:hypothetical protein
MVTPQRRTNTVQNIFRYVAVLAALTTATSAGAYYYHDLALGSAPDAVSTRSLSMGGTRIACDTSALAVATNPALVGFSSGFRFDGSLRLTKADADWASPVHDSFDGVLTWNIYSVNSHLYDDETAAVLYGFSGSYAPTFALAVGPIADFRYRYDEEVRDRDPFSEPQDSLVARNVVKSEGVFRGVTLGVGKTLLSDRVALGIAVQFATLSSDVEFASNVFSEIGDDLGARTAYVAPSGARVLLGTAVRVIPRLTLAAAYRLSVELEGDYSTTSYSGDNTTYTEDGTYALHRPASFSAGIEYRPIARLRSKVAVDIEYTQWSDVEFVHAGTASSYTDGSADSTWSFSRDDAPVTMDDVLEIRMGVEHRLGEDMPVRFGFRHRPEATDSDVGLTAFTFGLGVPVPHVNLDIGFEIGSRSYRAPDQFDDALFGGDPSESWHKVRESLFAAGVGVSYTF